MPNHKNPEKSLRKDKRRHISNVANKSRIRTLVKKVRVAVAENNSSDVMENLRQAVSALDTAAKKNVIHPRNAARKKSRLMRLVAQQAKS